MRQQPPMPLTSIWGVKMRPLTFGLVYHFNQNTVPSALVADRVCYRRLLEVFLSHPRCKFTIHFSGTLISALQWYSPNTIDLLRVGIDRGQFEILGSSFSQNILLATDEWDNIQQLQQHRRQINSILGANPVGFWNPERCWSQDMAKLTLDAGYEYTFVETHVFRRAGDQEHQALIRSTRDQGRKLVLFADDTNTLTVFGKAIQTGSIGELMEYLYNIWLAQNQVPERDFAVIYGQDAEATGLWQFETGEQSLDDVFDKLDALLSSLEEQPWLDIGGLAQKARNSHTACVEQLPRGQANWMADALRSQNRPWGEKGYANWFDYASHAAKNIEIREMYYRVSKRLQDQESRLAGYNQETVGYAASRRLYDLAVRTLIAHQYEFGCTGLEFSKEAPWQLARSALAVLWASQTALEEHQNRFVRKEDINHDGIDEITVVFDENAYVFAPKGGRLLYWFNLREGLQLTGNQNALCYFERYQDDHSYVPDFYGEKDIFPELKERPEIADLTKQRYVMRRRCLNDAVAFDSMRMVGLHDLVFDLEVVGGRQSPCLRFQYDGRLFSVQKVVTCLPDGIEVQYTIDGHLDAKQLRFRIENEITPDYLSVLDSGKQWVDVQTDGCDVTVVNRAHDCAVRVTATGSQASSIVSEVEPGFLAWLCSTEVAVDLAHKDRQPAHLSLSLHLT